MNIILNTDSYKTSHYLQYPPNTTFVNSYIEARGGVEISDKVTVFAGMQPYLYDYLSRRVTNRDILEAEDYFKMHGVPFNKEGWRYILKEHQGKLPLNIRAVKEGSVIPLRNVLVQVMNSDPNVPWLTSYIETSLLRAIWYPTTVATISWYIKQDFLKYAEKSGSIGGVDFKLHDFGARGVSSNESAMLGGIAHLFNFKGTDTVASLVAGFRYYGEQMAGYSIPAAEHSTITVWGKDNEAKAYENMLTQFAKPNSLVAVVSDSYDIYNATRNIWGEKLRQKVIDSGAVVVIRPDSGNAVKTPIEVIKILMDKFGYTTNKKGYHTLNNVKVIQGDGINRYTIKKILSNLDKEKLTLDNIAFGMGGALLQQVNRDTYKFAMKASWAMVDGKGVDVFKNPVSDSSKSSKPGILTLNYVDNKYVTRRIEENIDRAENLLVPVDSGTYRSSLAEIRSRTSLINKEK